MILKTEELTFGFADGRLFEEVNIQIDEGNKIALLGPNGSGKTSLIKLIIGEYQPVSGAIIKKNNLSIGYQTQFRITDPLRTLWKEYESVFSDVQAQIHYLPEITHDMLSFEKRIRSVLKGLGFEEEDWIRQMRTFSGGEQTRISLGKLFLRDFDLLILDEPTNHLDIAAIFWLQNYLKTFQNTLLMVSHDRSIVEETTNRIFEINSKKIWVFNTNYPDYLLQRERMNETLKRRRENLVKEVDRQQGIIEQFRRWNREKAFKLMHSREKVLEKLKVQLQDIDEMEENQASLGKLPFPDRTEWIVLQGKGVGKKFVADTTAYTENHWLFKALDFTIHRGEKIVLAGKNGIGKTTLLKMICGEDTNYSGCIEIGSKTKIGYLSQNLFFSDEETDIFTEIFKKVPDWKDYEVRKYAGRFGFVGEDVFKAIKNLSGGEKLKLSLAKIILEKPNLLILDEPTNHLDIESIEKLQQVFKEYEGAMLVVTHDQWLIKNAFEIVWVLNASGLVFPKSLDDFFDSVQNSQTSFRKKKESEKVKIEDYQTQKILKNKLRSLESQMQEVEKKYEKAEEQLSATRSALNRFSRDYQKLQEFIEKEKEISIQMEQLLHLLEELQKAEKKVVQELEAAQCSS